MFDDPNFVVLKDRIDEQTGEQRWHAIGRASFDEDVILLLVVHVYRSDDGEEIIRVISARKAGKRERKLYFQ
ncbi:MAG: BrnT family toxin [Acidobacteriota bacterium]|nr:BrnT family toxin [Acidobacteriota bacterium]